MSGFELLHILARFNYYGCFFIVCIAYYYMSSAERNSVREVSETGGRRVIYENHALSCMLVQVLAWNIGMCVILIVGCLRNDGTHYFLTWFPLNYLCNILLPQLICLFLTYLVCASWNPQIWIFAEVLILFLISPIAETIVWKEKPNIPIDLIWQKIRWPFQILYQNGEWSPDYQGDLQLEPVRIYILIFWVLFLLAIACYSIWNKKKTGKIIAVIAVIFLCFSYQPASLYRLNDSWNGDRIDLVEMRNKQTGENASDYETVTDFKIVDYDMELSMKNELEVKGQFILQSLVESDQFCMTLYRGYSVKEVQSETEGVSVQFEQEEDYLTVRTDKPVKELTVWIRYKGHHNKFYSNTRAAMLPGWFPWYPMAGERMIFWKDGSYYGYNSYNRIEPAHIRIKTNYPVFTNLSEKEQNCYEGESDSITVLGGNIEKTEDEVVLNYFPLKLYSDPESNYDAFITSAKQQYYDALNLLKRYGIDVTEWEGKKILFASKEIGRNFDNNFVAVFDDYLLTTPNFITAYRLFQSIIRQDEENSQRRKESMLIQNFVPTAFFSDDPEEMVANWSTSISQIQEMLNGFDATFFYHVLEVVDSEKLVKAMVDYSLNPYQFADDRAFLEAVEAMQ